MHTRRGIATPIILGLLALIALGGSYVYLKVTPHPAPSGASIDRPDGEMRGEETEMVENDAVSDETVDAMRDDGMEVPFSGMVLAGDSSPLLEFNSEDYEKALQSDRLITLFFYANWCPNCKAEFPKMQSVFNELKSDAVVGFRVSYNDDETTDEEVALAREFGVAYQHTKVFLKGGERVLKSPETWDKSRYQSEINKLIN